MARGGQRGGRGGRRTPQNPAPTSGPGAQSRRTDGGPSSDTQPVRGIPSDEFGGRQALTQQQRSAPMRGGGMGEADTSPPSRRSSPGGPRGPEGDLPDVFAPSRRPREPQTAGSPMGPGPDDPQLIPDDPYQSLRAVYAEHPHPDIAALLQQGGF